MNIELLGNLGAVGAAYQLTLGVWHFVAHCREHKNGNIPAGCVAFKLDRTRRIGYMGLGTFSGVAALMASRIESIAAALPVALFTIAVGLTVLGSEQVRRSSSMAARELSDGWGRYVEAATGMDQFGQTLWENYLEVSGCVAKLEEVGGRKPPELRAPAAERARSVRVLIRGEVREGRGITVHLDGRWQTTQPAEIGTLEEISRRERL